MRAGDEPLDERAPPGVAEDGLDGADDLALQGVALHPDHVHVAVALGRRQLRDHLVEAPGTPGKYTLQVDQGVCADGTMWGRLLFCPGEGDARILKADREITRTENLVLTAESV